MGNKARFVLGMVPLAAAWKRNKKTGVVLRALMQNPGVYWSLQAVYRTPRPGSPPTDPMQLFWGMT